ncbi:hypothetical protein LINGRAHAP2_LOCUS23157, partial [Linum grandiflorum]
GWFTLSTHGSFRSSTKVIIAGDAIRNDTGRFVKAFATNLRSCSITRAEMRAIVGRLQLPWTLGIRRIRFQSDSMTTIAIFAKDSVLDHQHGLLLCSSRSYAAANGMSIFLISTVKLIMLQITWLILAILSLMVCTFLIH